MGKKAAAGTPRKPRASKKRAAPGSKGLSPAECRDAALPELAAKIEGHGGAVLTCYKEPLGGNATIVAILPIDKGKPTPVQRDLSETHAEAPARTATTAATLPIDKVKPTPFQRDLSETHAKRLSDTIGKIGRFLDPIIAVNVGDEYWTPNGRHRLESLIRLGAKAVTALVLPDPEIQYKILALNIEKAHNLREKSLEVIRMYRAMAPIDDILESAHALE